VPADDVQAAAQVTIQKAAGCTRTYVLDDQGVYGQGLAKLVARAARARGLAIAGTDSIDPRAGDFRDVATNVSAAGADCVFFAGDPTRAAVRLFEDMHRADPSMRLFGPDALTDPAFTTRLPGAVQRLTSLTSPSLDPNAAPPAARQFDASYRRRFGSDPEQGAVFGYEAMKAVLAAIRAAGDQGNDPTAVVRAFFEIKDRDSALGKYSIDQNGDTTLTDYGVYSVDNGDLKFDQTIKAKTAG
jgi:branched-chain amino acid transport system substrate-binding protein